MENKVDNSAFKHEGASYQHERAVKSNKRRT